MKFKLLDKKQIDSLPQSPGVYALKKGGKFLYIGKAGNIRQRVKNHFQRPGLKQALFIPQIEKIAYIKIGSEIEALILEAELIKKYQPKFNTAWKDDKNYFYIAISNEECPRIFLTHQIKSQNSKLKTLYIIGPFVDGRALKQTLKALRTVFPYRTCKTLPKRPCLWHELNRCPAPCMNSDFTPKECWRNVRNLMKILQGRKKYVLKNLKKEMKKLAKKQDFEKAAKIREQIYSLEKTLQHSKILSASILQSMEVKKGEDEALKQLKQILGLKKIPQRIEGYDISNIQGQQAAGGLVVFERGSPTPNEYRKFRIKISGKPDDTAMLREILSRRFQHPEWKFPDLILIDGGRAQLNAAISEIKNHKLKTKNIKLAALAKRKNQLYLENKKEPILLKNLSQDVSHLILRVRDESHRFALKYHKQLRKRNLIKL